MIFKRPKGTDPIYGVKNPYRGPYDPLDLTRYKNPKGKGKSFYKWGEYRPPIRHLRQHAIWEEPWPLDTTGLPNIPFDKMSLKQRPRFATWVPTLEEASHYHHPKTVVRRYMNHVLSRKATLKAEQEDAYSRRFQALMQEFNEERKQAWNYNGEKLVMSKMPYYINKIKELDLKYPMASGGGNLTNKDDNPIQTRAGTKIYRQSQSHQSSSDGSKPQKIANTNAGDRTDHARGVHIPRSAPSGASLTAPSLPFSTGTQIDPGPAPPSGPLGGGNIAPVQHIGYHPGVPMGPTGWPMYIGGYPVMPRNLTFSFLDTAQNESRYTRARDFNRDNPSIFHPDYFRMS
jgi:hypothetical protein